MRSIIFTCVGAVAAMALCALATCGCNGIKSQTGFVPPGAAATPVPGLSGEWALVIDELLNDCEGFASFFDGTVTIEQEGDAITITAPKYFIATGTLDGDVITFTYTLDMGDNFTRVHTGTLNLSDGRLTFDGGTEWEEFDPDGFLSCVGRDDWSGDKTDGEGVLSGFFISEITLESGTCSDIPQTITITVDVFVEQVGDDVTFDTCNIPIQQGSAGGGTGCILRGKISGRTVTIDDTIDGGSFSVSRVGEATISEDFQSFELHIDQTDTVFVPGAPSITCESTQDWSAFRD